jgi:hypothetical protein
MFQTFVSLLSGHALPTLKRVRATNLEVEKQ